MDEKQTKRIEKIFPDYFDRFEMPAGAREENEIIVDFEKHLQNYIRERDEKNAGIC